MRTCPAVKTISFTTNVPRHTYHPRDDRHTALKTRHADRRDKSRGPRSQTRHLDPRESMTLVPQQQLLGGFTFQPLLILVASRRDCYNFNTANSGFAIHAFMQWNQHKRHNLQGSRIVRNFKVTKKNHVVQHPEKAKMKICNHFLQK